MGRSGGRSWGKVVGEDWGSNFDGKCVGRGQLGVESWLVALDLPGCQFGCGITGGRWFPAFRSQWEEAVGEKGRDWRWGGKKGELGWVK